MKQKVIMGMIIFIMLIGIGLMAYPSLANYVNNKFAINVINEYQKKIENTDDEELKHIIDQATAYNNSLPGAFPANPFDGMNISKDAKVNYKDFFMIQKDEMIGYIEIPKVDIYLPVYYGTSDTVLKKGVGVVENSSLPVAGDSTHSVLSAHTGLPSQELFTGVEDLVKGDTFFVHILNKVYAYRVNQIVVVLPEETEELMIQKNKTYVTLLTCTPYGINDHRLLIRGEYDPDFDFSSEEYHSLADKGKNDWIWMLVIGTAVVGGIITIIVLKKKKNRKIRKGESCDEEV